MQTRVALVVLMHQGKAKDSGWGSDDEAAAPPEAEATGAGAGAASRKQTARKQVASTFDLLQGSDDEPAAGASAANDGSDAEINGAASEPDSAADSDSDSDLGEQVVCCLSACILHLPDWQHFEVYCNDMQACLSKSGMVHARTIQHRLFGKSTVAVHCPLN